jgi:taurine--2-oxoglutarate transaminase
MNNETYLQHYLVPWAVQSQADYPYVTRGEGIYFYDKQDRRYMDFSSQLMNLNLGYNNQAVSQAIAAQLEKLPFIGPGFPIEAKVELSRLLAEITPGSLAKAFYTTGGSTANEIAVIMARLYTNRSKIITRYKSYHGSTWETLSISGDERRISANVSAPGVIRFPAPYCYRCDVGRQPDFCNLLCLNLLNEAIELEGPETVAALFAEPITGTNRCIVPPDGYYSKLKEICRRYGILFVADEVISGFGRTGKWFAIEHWNEEPDMITMGKGINSCYIPLGAVMVSQKIADFFEHRYLPVGYTNSAHPLACASAAASISYCIEQQILRQVEQNGAYLLGLLADLARENEIIGDIRGKGLHTCLELVEDRESKAPLKMSIMAPLQKKLMERGLYTLVRWNILFISPPLIITREQIDEGVTLIGDLLKRIRG